MATAIEKTEVRSLRPESSNVLPGVFGKVSVDNTPVSASRSPPTDAASLTFAPVPPVRSGSSDREREGRMLDAGSFDGVSEPHVGERLQTAMAKDGVAPNEQLAPARTQQQPSPVRQVAEAIITGRGNKVEVQLEPEELGRVRFHMQLSEHGITLQVSAERPETLDLLRRNADQLARFLTEAGYQGGSLSFFGQRRGGGTSRGRTGGPEAGLPDMAAAQGASPTAAPGPVPSAGLDLRL
ncbi:flagellar hook-length control protein FliK [Salipiger pacificus]|nr:flagellar hook-length control protein FliK [Alloyangia pacifica]MCA0945355.1 flagellar hook-length control protein FliK [Alloyangia pacifica]